MADAGINQPNNAPGAWIAFHDKGKYLEPAVHFLGDETIINTDYAACMDKVYVGTMARSFCAVAEGFGVPMTPERYERTKRMLALSKTYDDWLDTPDNTLTRSGRFTYFKAIVTSGSAPDRVKALLPQQERLHAATSLWENAARVLSPSERQRLTRLSLSLGGLTQAKTKAKNLAQYQFLACGEGQRAGILWAEALCAGEPQVPPGARHYFIQLLGNVGVVATLVDAGLDMRKDHNNELIGLKPKILSRVSLAMAGLGALQGVVTREALRAHKNQPVTGLGYLTELLKNRH